MRCCTVHLNRHRPTKKDRDRGGGYSPPDEPGSTSWHSDKKISNPAILEFCHPNTYMPISIAPSLLLFTAPHIRHPSCGLSRHSTFHSTFHSTWSWQSLLNLNVKRLPEDCQERATQRRGPHVRKGGEAPRIDKPVPANQGHHGSTPPCPSIQAKAHDPLPSFPLYSPPFASPEVEFTQGSGFLTRAQLHSI